MVMLQWAKQGEQKGCSLCTEIPMQMNKNEQKRKC